MRNYNRLDGHGVGVHGVHQLELRLQRRGLRAGLLWQEVGVLVPGYVLVFRILRSLNRVTERWRTRQIRVNPILGAESLPWTLGLREVVALREGLSEDRVLRARRRVSNVKFLVSAAEKCRANGFAGHSAHAQNLGSALRGIKVLLVQRIFIGERLKGADRLLVTRKVGLGHKLGA